MPNKDKQRYQKKDQITHCLDRPDMYVGSTRLRKTDEYVADHTDGQYAITLRSISSSPAIVRVFVEALSNAIDNVERSRQAGVKCTRIRVTIDRETGRTSVWNDGDVVPVEMNEEEKCFIHTMIFGQLLTGSNYDDEEERVTSGRNGLGIKLTNVFARELTVEGADPRNRLVLRQTWTNNMRETEGPSVKKYSKQTGYTEVSWVPDFARFGLSGYTDDIIALYKRYVIDAAMLTKMNIYLNDELIPVKNLTDYARLYPGSSDEKAPYQDT